MPKKKLVKLKKLFDIEDIVNKVNKCVQLKIDADDFSDTIGIGSSYSYEPKSKLLVLHMVNFDDLPKEQQDCVFKAIHAKFDLGQIILREDKLELLNTYRKYSNKEGRNVEILTFFKGKIPANDYEALKMAIFIQHEFKKGVKVGNYVHDVRSKFGQRGVLITNLCTADYFSDVFKPIYENDGKEAFENYYNIAVVEKALALFVHKNMDEIELEQEVDKMVSKAIKHHSYDIRIHGRGDRNIGVIKKFVISNRTSDLYYLEKEIDDKKLKVIEYSVHIL